jgi:hypothetical protein
MGCSDRYVDSISSRISKGQGYRGFLRKRAGSSFGQKKGNLCRIRKNGQNINLFFLNYIFLNFFFKGQGAPGKEKGTRAPPGVGRARRPSKNA